jgi:Spy/CpxP family protein refolding chaperone
MSKVVVILGFLVSFAAGLTVGWRVMPHPTPSSAVDDSKPPQFGGKNGPQNRPSGGNRDQGPTGWLTAVLKLSVDQQEKMKEIWSATAHEGRKDREERRQALKKTREESVTNLMAESGRKTDFDKIDQDFKKGLSDLDAEWKAKFQAAVEQTKAILTDEQRTKYEEILKRHASGPQPGPRGENTERSPGRRPETRATSRPDRQDPPTSRD